MAEGGEPDDKRNPFSFQNFLKASTDRASKVENDKENNDIFSEPDLGIPRTREKNKLMIIDEEKSTRREENPFSFRQFLKNDQPSVKSVQGGSVTFEGESTKANIHSAINENCKARGPHLATAPDFASGLPDFVQDHFVLGSVLHEAKDATDQLVSNDDDGLPDFTLNSQSQSNCTSKQSRCDDDMICHPKKSLPKGTQDDLLFSLSGKARNIRRSAVPQADVAITSSLPDFLSDGPMLGSCCGDRVDKMPSNEASALTISDTDNKQTNGNTMAGIALLRAENESLVKQLRDTRHLLSVESQKVYELNKEVDNLRKKEADETAALEKMVQQVESNLKSTTQRAISGENTISKLKQEIKALQGEILLLRNENASLNSSDGRLPAIMEKARTASDQISAAASSAEQQLKQLLSGVESLKLTAAYLADIDKVTEDFTYSSKSKT